MENQTRRDIKITGNGSTSGGLFNKVRITGEGRVNGDLDCLLFRSVGNADIQGSVKAEHFTITGNAVIQGDLISNEAKIRGRLEIGGDLKCKHIKFISMSEIQGRIIADQVEMRGWAKARGDCQAEVIRAEGAFEIDGLLNAGNIQILLHGSSQIKEIGGEKISIRRGGIRNFFRKIFTPHSQGRLTAETIEGDEIYLSGTKAQVVRGNKITIGPGCEVERVEYIGSFQQSKRSKVHHFHKV